MAKIRELAWNGLRVASHVLGKLLNMKFVYITMMFFMMIWLLSNYSVINASQIWTFTYVLMAVVAVVFAMWVGIDWEKLRWEGFDPIEGRLVEGPHRLLSMLMLGVVSFLGTIGVLLLFNPGVSQSPFDIYTKFDLVNQQLWIVSLTETMVFQGMVPLIMYKLFVKELADKKDTNPQMISMAWGVVYLLSQTFFAVMHTVVYQGDFPNMIKVGIWGMVWVFMFKRGSPMAAWLSHFAFNLYQIGIIG